MIKKLTGTYQIGIEELNNLVIIENPSIYIDVVADRILSKICNIHVIFRDVANGIQHEEIITGFKYEDTWSDEEIEEWAINELKQFEIL
jgi:hypothetical protein